MTPQQLAQHDGRNGRKAFVAVNGKIYDVTSSPLWRDGDHQGAHQAGGDLTEELKGAPHVRAVIERFPLVADLTTANPAPSGGKLAVIAVLVLALVALVFFWVL